jgi:tRNA (Thr-GGU) A37 N-methylase
MTEQRNIHKRAIIKEHMARRVEVIIVVVFLAISLLHLLRLLTVPGLDSLDGTPLIDIKPAMGRE